MTETRQIRAQNYAAKRDHDFRCSTDGCHAHDQILVVEGPNGLTTSCERHLAGRKPTRGQWLEAEATRKAEAAKAAKAK